MHRVGAHLSYSYKSRESKIEDRKDEKDTEGYHIPSYFVGDVMLIR